MIIIIYFYNYFYVKRSELDFFFFNSCRDKLDPLPFFVILFSFLLPSLLVFRILFV